MTLTRNEKITIAVLRGWTLESVGNVFGISRSRVAQIFNRTMRRHSIDHYHSIKNYRKNKHRLISIILQQQPLNPER